MRTSAALACAVALGAGLVAGCGRTPPGSSAGAESDAGLDAPHPPDAGVEPAGSWWRLEPTPHLAALGHAARQWRVGQSVSLRFGLYPDDTCQQPGPVEVHRATSLRYVVEGFLWRRQTSAAEDCPPINAQYVVAVTLPAFEAAGTVELVDVAGKVLASMEVTAPPSPAPLGDRGDDCRQTGACRAGLACLSEGELGTRWSCQLPCTRARQGYEAQRLGAAGASCAPAESCGVPDSSSAERCVPNASDACTSSADCSPGEQCVGVGGPHACDWASPQLPSARPCTSDSDCGPPQHCLDPGDGPRCAVPCVSGQRCPGASTCGVGAPGRGLCRE